jgi:hypothetical protein
MNREGYKTKRKGQPKKNNSAGRAKRRASVEHWTPTATPKLLQVYATQTEWATKLMPKVKETVETPK